MSLPLPKSLAPFRLGAALNAEENRFLEFMEVTASDPIDSIKNSADEYAVAFLNSEGGTIIWGIGPDGRYDCRGLGQNPPPSYESFECAVELMKAADRAAEERAKGEESGA